MEEILKLIDAYWKFDNYQIPQSSWHDKQALLEAVKKVGKNFVQPDVRFRLPSENQMFEIAILFNDGKLEAEKLADMVGYGQFIVNRLFENGDVGKRSSKEEGD